MNSVGGKVAVVTPYYYPRVGGLENYARQSVQTLRKAGFEIIVVTSAHEGRGGSIDEVDGVAVHRLPRLLRVLNTPLHPLWPLWLRGLFAREGAKVIVAHTPVPAMADAARAARGRRPFILTYHNDLVKDGSIAKLVCDMEYRLLTGPTLSAADTVIVTSEHYATSSPRLQDVQEKIVISSPGVDTALFGRTGSQAPVQGRFLFVGQLDRTHRHKGLERLLEAVRIAKVEVPEISLLVAGRGNDRDRYIALAQMMGLGNAVEFCGFVPDETLRDLYASSWAVVLPSEHDAEGFGMVVLEAAACGTPAIASNVGGIPAAVVEGETGLLVPPGDVKELAGALVHIASDDELRKRLAENAYQRTMSTFTWEIQGKALVSSVQAAMERAGRVYGHRKRA